MRIVGRFSFNNGEREVDSRYGHLKAEIEACVHAVQAHKHKTKISREKTMPGRRLFSPKALNRAFEQQFTSRNWTKVRVPCNYSAEHFSSDYEVPPATPGAFREIDFVKDRLGVEIQFGKYAFMVYNVCAKMTIFRNLGHIDCGVEIVPVKSFANEMSTGVSYFEQFVWDLTQRGVADIDIPVLILAISA